MADVRNIVSLIHAIRKKHQLKVRQPLLRALIPAKTEHMRHAIDHLKGLIAHETNLKNIEVISTDSDLIQKTAKLNFKNAGRKLGALVNTIATQVKELDAVQLLTLEAAGEISLTAEGKHFVLTLEDIDLATKDVPGWIISTDGDLTVALDLTLTDDLVQEGMARELVNRIQNLRKDSGLDVTDRVAVRLQTAEAPLFTQILASHSAYIKEEVQADVLELVAEPQEHSTEVENILLTLALTSVSKN
jgi:isoleucyl-tRNA synthetase